MATSFIPDLKKTINFEELCISSGFNKNCLDSARHLDNVVNSIHQNIAEGTNYFKVNLITQINKYLHYKLSHAIFDTICIIYDK